MEIAAEEFKQTELITIKGRVGSVEAAQFAEALELVGFAEYFSIFDTVSSALEFAANLQANHPSICSREVAKIKIILVEGQHTRCRQVFHMRLSLVV